MIHTDAEGRPFERPARLAVDAPVEDKVAYVRAVHAYNDAAFAEGFARALRAKGAP